MKALLTILLIGCLAGSSWGQGRGTTPAAVPIDGTTHRILYTAVVPVAGVSRADLLARAQAWAKGKATSDKPVVVTSEPDTEQIVVRGVHSFVEDVNRKPNPLHYVATIALRDGRYKYELTDFVLEYPGYRKDPATMLPVEDYYNGRVTPTGESGAKAMDALRRNFAADAAKLVAGLKEAMSQPVPVPQPK
jgi:hypothetical protein